jgi:putative oxidoreductase
MNSIKLPLVVAGRLLLALMFVVSGFGKLTNIAGTAGYIASAGLPAASLLAVGAGLLELLAGIALIVGFKARWAALALGLFTLLASVLFHAYWAAPAAQAYVQQLMFMKNLAVAGGMFLVASLGAGPFSLDARRVAA